METPPASDRYERWISEHEPNEESLSKQRRDGSAPGISVKISLLVPVYNTDPEFVQPMLRSVSQQTYPNWELCIVDAGSDRDETVALLSGWKEPRLRLERLERNLGIAENTNRALAMATGDFIALLDHDDLLAPFALFELARAIQHWPKADIFYSDEDRISADGRRHSPFFKPEWSPELLYACMYLGHLTAYRRELAEDLGGFRKEFDLSQDYDFALRATERARGIQHIPHILYHWREHPASGSVGGKPGARKTNLAALADAMERRGLPAEIVGFSTANRARLKIKSKLRVSIVIPSDSPERVEQCAIQLPAATSFENFEVIVVTNSRLADALARKGEKSDRVRVIRYDQEFNFSLKCNLGAAAAKGDRLVFLNDDVEPLQRDWIENLMEPLENPEVGAVGPKSLYRTETVQHAGLVTGVRGFVGTPFHQLPHDSTVQVNFLQSMRDVSALSAACLAMRRDDFVRLDGFEAEHLPIFHSDLDLSFKIRAAGMRCVYTPFVVVLHRGHSSLGALSDPADLNDASDLYLLRRWGGYVAHDPYFPENMRDWLYPDSATPITISARNHSDPGKWKWNVLLITSDLESRSSGSDLLRIAIWCDKNGIFPVVLAAADGALREKCYRAGITVVVDPLLFREEPSFQKFFWPFDYVIVMAERDAFAFGVQWAEDGQVIWCSPKTRIDNVSFSAITSQLVDELQNRTPIEALV